MLNVRHCMQIFIFAVGVFFSSWLGTALLNIGEWMIKRLPLVKHIYSASKQVIMPGIRMSAAHFGSRLLSIDFGRCSDRSLPGCLGIALL